MSRMDDMKAIVSACDRCALSKTRTQVVFGAGDEDAEFLFIGEAPGKREDETGVPFVGAAGRLLDKTLGAVGLSRADVYIANVLKCRPPGNRNPSREEIALCRPYLEEQIERVDPAVLVPMGNFALRLFREGTATIGEEHGREFSYRDRTVVPIYHPAAILYNRSLEPELVEDLRKIAALARLPREAPGGSPRPTLF